jgi:hypothetical protein
LEQQKSSIPYPQASLKSSQKIYWQNVQEMWAKHFYSKLDTLGDQYLRKGTTVNLQTTLENYRTEVEKLYQTARENWEKPLQDPIGTILEIGKL